MDATALISGTDFTQDARYGMLTPTAAGAIDEGDRIIGFASSFAVTGRRLRGGVRSSVTWAFMGPGKELKSGRDSWLYIPKIVSYASEAWDFVTDAANASLKEVTLTGKPLVAAGFAEAYLFDDGLTYASA